MAADFTFDDIKTAARDVNTAEAKLSEEVAKRRESQTAIERAAWEVKRNSAIGDPAMVSIRKMKKFTADLAAWKNLPGNEEKPIADRSAVDLAKANVQAKKDALTTLNNNYKVMGSDPHTAMCNHIHSQFLTITGARPWQWHKNKKTKVGHLVMYFTQKIKFGDTEYYAVAHLHSSTSGAGSRFTYSGVPPAQDKLEIDALNLQICDKWTDFGHSLGDVIGAPEMNAHADAAKWLEFPDQYNVNGASPPGKKVFPAQAWNGGDLYFPEYGHYVDSAESSSISLGSAYDPVTGYAAPNMYAVVMSAMVLLTAMCAILCVICSFCVGGVMGYVARPRLGWKSKTEEEEEATSPVDHVL